MKKTQLSLLAVSVLLASQVHAAGFQVVEHSASGLGRAFSGDGAVGDNASEMSANPATMVLFDRAQFSIAGSYLEPEIDVDNKTTGESNDDIAPSAFVPAIYYLNPINENWVWGVGLYTDYGVETKYEKDFAFGEQAGNTSLMTFKLNPNLAYRINDHFSLGAGVSAVYAKAELKRYKGNLSALPIPALAGAPSDNLMKMKGDTVGWGWNVGALIEIDDNNRFSIGYKSAVKLKFRDGDFTDGTGAKTGIPGKKVDSDLDLDLPDILEIAGFHQLTPKWAVHYSWQWTNYSKFDEIKSTSSQCAGGECVYKGEDYSDAQRWAIGATYNINEQWIARAGFAYDEQAGEPTASIPDADRYWYTAGLTYLWTDNLSLDAGFAYIQGDTVEFTESSQVTGQPYRLKADGPAYLSAVQLNYSF
ncbi:MAG: outer membrane protein transport protein [Vibrio sp.]